MNSADPLPTSEKSVCSSPTGKCGWHRALWGVSLLLMASLLAMHVALAHSPDLARYVPDRLIQTQSPASCSAHHAAPVISGSGGCSHSVMPVFSGCGGRSFVEPPVLTDSLYEDGEDIPEDQTADAPADADECLQNSESESRPSDLQV